MPTSSIKTGVAGKKLVWVLTQCAAKAITTNLRSDPKQLKQLVPYILLTMLEIARFITEFHQNWNYQTIPKDS